MKPNTKKLTNTEQCIPHEKVNKQMDTNLKQL